MRPVKNFWFPILLSKELKNKPIAAKIFGIPIVCFRDRSGTARTLLDLCPHQAASLSLGTIVDGNLRCALHHWDFNGEGRCVKAKLLDSEKIPSKAKAASFPTLEGEGLVWVWPGKQTEVTQQHSDLCLPEEETIKKVYDSSGVAPINWLTFMRNSSDAYHFFGLHHRTLRFIAPESEQIQYSKDWHGIEGDRLIFKSFYQDKLVGQAIYSNPFSVLIKVTLRRRKLDFWYEIYAAPVDLENTRVTFRLHVGTKSRVTRFLTEIFFGSIYTILAYLAVMEDIPVLESQTQNRFLGARENLCYLDRQTIAYNKYISAYELEDLWFENFENLSV